MALIFPDDTKNDVKYEAKVRFRSRRVQTFDIGFLFDGVQSRDRPNPQGNENLSNLQLEQENLVRALGSSSFNGQDTETSTKMANKQSLEPYDSNIDKTCILYLPQAVQITDNAMYDNVDLGIIGAGAEAAFAQGQNVGEAAVGAIKGAIKSIVDTAKGNKDFSTETGRLAVSRASNLLPNEQLRGAVRAGTRAVVNPNTRALFKQVPLREFAFNFKMIPTSKKETKNIKDIVEFFRTELYPAIIPGVEGFNAGYEFPNVFEIQMYYRDKNNHLATKILPSYIRSFSATYNSGSMAFLEGGDFNEVDISMSFIESSALHKGLIGGDPRKSNQGY